MLMMSFQVMFTDLGQDWKTLHQHLNLRTMASSHRASCRLVIAHWLSCSPLALVQATYLIDPIWIIFTCYYLSQIGGFIAKPLTPNQKSGLILKYSLLLIPSLAQVPQILLSKYFRYAPLSISTCLIPSFITQALNCNSPSTVLSPSNLSSPNHGLSCLLPHQHFVYDCEWLCP